MKGCTCIFPIALVLAVFLLSCSDHKVAGGNSAESGNPELAGTLGLADGSPAAGTRIQCVPVDFDALAHDSLSPNRKTISDSLGAFRFDSLPSGVCALEAFHEASGMRLLVQNLHIQDGKTLSLQNDLQPTGTVRVGITGYADGATGTVVVPGTSIARPVVVKFGSVFVDSLPADKLNLLVFMSAQGERVVLDSNRTVVTGDTLSVSTIPIHFSKRISLNTTPLGADLRETLVGFPLALKLDSNALDFTVLSPGAGRLRIFNGDSTKQVPFRIAAWDALKKNAQIWIRLDTLYAQDAAQGLIVVWDEQKNPPASSLAPLPFAATDGYIASWHFDEGTSQVLDAGSLGFDGEPFAVTGAMGVVGQGLHFNGTSSYVSIPQSASGPLNFSFTDSMTISVWVNFNKATTSRFVLGKGTYQYYLKYLYPNGWLFEDNDEQDPTMRSWFLASFDTLADVNQWWLLTVVQTGTHVNFYRNDSLMDSSVAIGLAPNPRYTESNLQIGRRLFPDGTSDQNFLGDIDEVQISDRDRSSEWVRLTYLNQKPSGYWP